MIIEFVKNTDGLVTSIKVDGTEHILKTPVSEHYLRTSKMPNAIELTDGTFLSFKKAGGTAQTTPEIPEDATFAEVLQQAEDSKELFIGNYARDKIDATLLEHTGSSTARGTYYNSDTAWRSLFNITNAYIEPDLEEDLFNYLVDHLGTYVRIKLVFGDNRVALTSRFSPAFEITELDKEYVFQYEKNSEAWNYDLTIEIRSSDRKVKFSIVHGAKAGDRAKHGTGYGAIRGLWFEEIT